MYIEMMIYTSDKKEFNDICEDNEQRNCDINNDEELCFYEWNKRYPATTTFEMITPTMMKKESVFTKDFKNRRRVIC